MITLKKLMDAPEFKEITVAAGSDGMDQYIYGVNLTESLELSEFYRPGELLVTTGLNITAHPDKLLEMAKTAFQHQAAGIVFNIGPYIPIIPESVLYFAEEHKFPIFQMPWQYRIADFLRLAIGYLTVTRATIIKQDQILTTLLFSNTLDEEWISQGLARAGFKKSAEFGIIVCMTDNEDVKATSFTKVIESELSRRYRLYLSTVYKNHIIYLVDRTEVLTPSVPFSKTATLIQKKTKSLAQAANLYIGMGAFTSNIQKIVDSYKKAKIVIHLAQKHHNPFLYKYKEIGAYKIIMEINDKNIIKKFHEDMLGALYRYDQLHATDYFRFLRIFLEEDGSTANISRREFIHRNTVLYKTKKIETLLDVDLNHSFTKVNLSIAFMIDDILK